MRIKTKRMFEMDSVELRRADPVSGQPAPAFETSGHAAVFNVPTELWPDFWEVISDTAFDKVLADPAALDCRHLINHERNMVLGRTKSGTHRVWKDETGLAFWDELPETTFAADLVVLMRRKDVTQCSFAFSMSDEGAEWGDHQGKLLRKINTIDELYDTSIVTYAAFPTTDALLTELREAGALIGEHKLGREGIGPQLRTRLESLTLELRNAVTPSLTPSRADSVATEIEALTRISYLRRRLDLLTLNAGGIRP